MKLQVIRLEDRLVCSTVKPGVIIIAPQGNAQPAITPQEAKVLYGLDAIRTFHNSKTGVRVAADGRGQKIVIVDAYDNPHAEADLERYDALFGLPNPVFKVFKMGNPSVDKNWGAEIDLDIQVSHALATRAEIDLVEAADSSIFSMINAVQFGASIKGATIMSLSWGGGDIGTIEDNIFTPPTPLVVFASSGDSGAAVNWPAASRFVVGVGGTTAFESGGIVNSEVAWSGSGGGIGSSPQNASQAKLVKLSGRGIPDVAGDSDPITGFAVVDPDFSTREDGQIRVGGTSVMSPYYAGATAVLNEGRSVGKKGFTNTTQLLGLIYSAPQQDFRDITEGSNGEFSAKVGYDLVTGRGPILWNRFIAFAGGAPFMKPVIAQPFRGQFLGGHVTPF